MGAHLDRVPFSGIIRIRDLMYTVRDPYRLDQGDVSFDAPDSVKAAMEQAIRENRSHYVQTTGLPRLRELLAEKLRLRNRVPVGDPDEIMVTAGGIHGLFLVCQVLLDPGDELLVPDPLWPPVLGSIVAASGVPRACRLRRDLGWRFDLDELAAAISPRTRGLYLNSPHNPTGGVLTHDDLAAIAELAVRHDLWVISDEAYEDIVFDGASHESLAAFPDLYERTIPIYTFSKSWAMTGLRLGYFAVRNRTLRERARKVLFLTASNVSTVVQHGGIGALEGPQDTIAAFARELDARRHLFYDGLAEASGGHLAGVPPRGAFYAFVRMQGDWSRLGARSGARAADATISVPEPLQTTSPSWKAVELLVSRARIGCVPGIDFGPNGEDHIRFCFARDRHEIAGALASMKQLMAPAD